MNNEDRAVDMIKRLLSRYDGATIDTLERILLPIQIPIASIDRTVERHGAGYFVRFTINEGKENPHLFRGRSGKVVPASAKDTGQWEELIKARIHDVDHGSARGELHYGGSRAVFEQRLKRVAEGDLLEIDRFGATAKVESALTEAAFMQAANAAGYRVTRMPEDIAQHLGAYYDFDFLVEKDSETKKFELKSLWGTDTTKARLIHSKGKRYPTSSCRFDTQDIFVVNLWLRTGRITDIAYTRSVRKDEAHPYGLPHAPKFPEHVHQNPPCAIGDGTWFASLDEVWNLP